uniref:Uncharacterized protein n=1 Tax=Junco hyemalis TaxID=40217 RepID=A0A8C5JFF6_JUNHY
MANSQLSLLPLGVSPSSAQGEGTPQLHALAKGRNAMLPCSFSPEQHAQHTEVSWFWEQLSPFLLKDGPAQGSTHLKIFHNAEHMVLAQLKPRDRGRGRDR